MYTNLESTGYLPVCAFYLGNQVDDEFANGGVNGALYSFFFAKKMKAPATGKFLGDIMPSTCGHSAYITIWDRV